VGVLFLTTITITIRPTTKTTHPTAIPAITVIDNERPPADDAVWSDVSAWGVGKGHCAPWKIGMGLEQADAGLH